MKPITILFALVLGLGLPAAALAQSLPAHGATLTVSGTGSVSHQPDRATLPVSIVTNDDNATRALSANNTSYARVLAAVKGLGMPANAIRTTGFSTQFNPHPQQPNPQFSQRFGFVVTRNLEIATDTLDRVGPILDALTAAGVTSIDGISYGFRDPRAIEREAGAAAVADAQAQADALAAAAHQRIARILAISTAAGPLRFPQPVMFRTADATALAVPTDITPSAQEVTANVTIVYEIAPK